MSANTSIKQIVAAVKLECDIETTQFDSWLMLVTNEYVREFNVIETTLKKQVNCVIEGNMICLPDDFYALGVLTATCVTYPNWQQYQQSQNPNNNPGFLPAPNPILPSFPMIYFDSNCVNGWGCNTTGCQSGQYQINGDKIVLLGDIHNIQSAVLCYEAYATDAYGNFNNIPKDFESACVWRIAHRYMLKKRKDFSADVIQFYDAKALAMYNMVRGKSNLRRFRNQRPQLLDEVNAILSNKNVYGYGRNFI